jgi:Fur family transcriptional regulator, ferric uptake regulator
MASRERKTRIKKLPCGRPLTGCLSGGGPELTQEDKAAIQTKLEQHLQQRGLNRSEVRDKLLEAILQCDGHFTGPELIQRVHILFPGVGAATVYRNLPILIEAGVLRESLNDREGQVVYELQGAGHHDHIVCLDCHAILEFHESRIENLQHEVMGSLGFEEVQHRHVVYAHCDYRKKSRVGKAVIKAQRPSYISSAPGAV